MSCPVATPEIICGSLALVIFTCFWRICYAMQESRKVVGKKVAFIRFFVVFVWCSRQMTQVG